MFWAQRVPPVDSVGLLGSPAAAGGCGDGTWVPVSACAAASPLLATEGGQGDLDLGAPYCLGINGGLKRAKHWAYRRGPAPWVPSGSWCFNDVQVSQIFPGDSYEVQAGDTAQPSVVSSHPGHSFSR